MSINTEQFVVDAAGNRNAVLIDMERYSELLEAQEELESIRAFDRAKLDNEAPIPFSQAIREIEESRP